ncbi:Nucleolar protein 16 [Cryptotrichosporon argae]
MANPRQRNKSRSSTTRKPSLAQKKRMHAKLRKAPALRGPAELAAAWDKTKTVFQNYKALGLLPSLPVPKAASQKQKLPFVPDALTDATFGEPAASSSSAAAAAAAPPKPAAKFGRIIRDADGNVVDIIIDGEEDDEAEAAEAIEVDAVEDDEEEARIVEAKTDVVRKLEAISSTAAPVKRHASTNERAWLADLVRVHGDDYARMARDRQRNVWQKTEGEIKRMVRRAGGVDRLAKLEA